MFPLMPSNPAPLPPVPIPPVTPPQGPEQPNGPWRWTPSAPLIGRPVEPEPPTTPKPPSNPPRTVPIPPITPRTPEQPDDWSPQWPKSREPSSGGAARAPVELAGEIRKAIEDTLLRRESSVSPAGNGIDIPWGLIATLAAGATGVGIPVWAVTAWRGAKAIRRIREAKQPPGSPEVIERTVTVNTKRPTERHWFSTEFINVESDHYQRAHERARQEVVHRYPGCQEILEAELSLTRQYAAGYPPAKPH